MRIFSKAKPESERRAVKDGKVRLVLLTEIISPYRIPVFNSLAKCRDIDLHVIFLAETDPTQRKWLVYKGEIEFSYQVLRSWRQRIGGYHVLANRGLGKALRCADPNVIICGGYNYIASWQALLWARRNEVPFITWVESTQRDLRRGNVVVEFLKKRFLALSAGFVVPGQSSLEYLRGFGIDPSNVFVAPNAVDNSLFSSQSSIARQNAVCRRRALGLPNRYFLFAGRLVKEKGVFDLVEAYGKLSADVRSEVSLVFVGNGPIRQDLERHTAQIAPGHIQFKDFAQRELLAEYYGLAEVFVFPTWSDPWGLVINEAMACSLPVICSDAAGCAQDLVADDENGRLVPARQIAQLASAMEELASDKDHRFRMGQRSFERIQKNSPDNCAQGIAQAALSCRARPNA
jgi:glycosyltransferase involved in cell wall biosynthesis